MKKLLLILFGILPLFLSLQTVHAQSSEKIINFKSEVVVSEDSTAHITEAITYDFGSNQRRGIFRDIPVTYIVSGDQGYELSLVVLSVSRDGRPEQYRNEGKTGNFERLRIGNPDVTISGAHTYVIEYELSPIAIMADDGNAIVRIDAPGTGWPVPTEKASIIIRGPTEPITQTCYEGDLGNTAQTCKRNDRDFQTFSSSGVLAAGETLTAESAFDAGAFNRFAELTTVSSGGDFPVVVAWIFGAIGLIISLFVGKRIMHNLQYKSRRGKELVIAQYEPPKDMTPAEMGLLIDNSSKGAEFSATVIDLAVRGYLKIVQTKEKKWWSNAEYDFVKQAADPAALVPYERQIYNAIFEKGDKTSMKTLRNSTKLRGAYQSLRSKLVKRLEKRGFYKPVSVFERNLDARVSEAGYKTWAEVAGFRKFLEVTEKDRMAFHDAPERTPEQFSKYLPYAVALGVEKQWAKQFRDLTIDTSDWYEGNTLNAIIFANSIHGLSNSLSSMATASTSSGSSGVGGGFSGGGFSGGGGGSW